MARERVPGYITKQVSNDFGLEVHVQRQVYPKQDMYSSGDPVPEGQAPTGQNFANDRRFREVIPPGSIGTSETQDLDVLTPPQYVNTVDSYTGEQNDPSLHGSVNQFKVANPTAPGIPFQSYPSFQPRNAPMPRAAQDQVYLEGYGMNAADPRMTDESSMLGLQKTDKPDRANLYGDNRDGVLHNENHPGFSAVQSKIEGEGYSRASAGAILASASRKASAGAKKSNPNLNRVKG